MYDYDCSVSELILTTRIKGDDRDRASARWTAEAAAGASCSAEAAAVRWAGALQERSEGRRWPIGGGLRAQAACSAPSPAARAAAGARVAAPSARTVCSRSGSPRARRTRPGNRVAPAAGRFPSTIQREESGIEAIRRTSQNTLTND